MSTPTSARTSRTANARLQLFLASQFPEAVKARVAAIVADLETMWAAKKAAAIPPHMLTELQHLLSVPRSVALDLLNVLFDRKPHLPGSTRQAVGALMRAKRKKLGRRLTLTDFPPNHPVHLFAACYWGGIETWGAGAPDRVQQPKGYWRDESNQIAAIRAFAAAYPDKPITTGNLDRAGYHALCVALNGQDIDALVAKAGLPGRQLKRDPNGRAAWTAEVILDAYIVLCRKWGVTLTTEGLRRLKGAASSLRGHAQRVFGGFRAMVDAARRIAPDLRPLKSYFAADGTQLDSNSEVVAWNALRRAFPNADLRAHVILAGSKRSADVLINGTVYVEVLMIAVVGMPRPSSEEQAKYARQWAEKEMLYAALGITPRLIEPADIYDPAQLALRIAEIGLQIGLAPVPPAPPSVFQTRAKGFWTYKALCTAVAEVAALKGAFPTYAQLAVHSYGHAVVKLREPGMRQRVANTLGLTLINCKGVWSRQRIVDELLAWIREHGQYPSAAELVRAKRSDLLGAIQRLGRGGHEVLRAEVETMWGETLPRRRRPDGSYASLESTAKLLRPLAERLGRLPTRRECAPDGLGAAWDVVSRRWGIEKLAAHLRLPKAPRGPYAPRGPRLF